MVDLLGGVEHRAVVDPHGVRAPPRPDAVLAGVPAAMIDLDRLLKLRLVVARDGEMDMAGWWNTNGMLGRYGAIALGRGAAAWPPEPDPATRRRAVCRAGSALGPG